MIMGAAHAVGTEWCNVRHQQKTLGVDFVRMGGSDQNLSE